MECPKTKNIRIKYAAFDFMKTSKIIVFSFCYLRICQCGNVNHIWRVSAINLNMKTTDELHVHGRFEMDYLISMHTFSYSLAKEDKIYIVLQSNVDVHCSL